MEKGILYCVSVGPGDPELMTLKAVRVIKSCPVLGLAVDDLKKEEDPREACVAYRIARGAVSEAADKEALYLPLPMTKDPALLEAAYERGAEQIVRCLDSGRSVACLTLGDAAIYAGCMYYAQRVQERGYPVEIISGVTSFCAAAARLGRSLVSGSQELHILPSSYSVEQGLDYPGVKVLMKAGKQIGPLRELLRKKGCRIQGVQRCGMEGEQVYRSLEELEETPGYYTLLIVSEEKED